MKINIIGTGLFFSGGMRVIFEYANRLTKRGHDVIFYYPFKQYNFNNENIMSMLRRYKWSMSSNIFEQKKIKSLYKCNFKIKGVPVVNSMFVRDADVSVATQWPTAYDVSKLSRKKGKKVYFLQDYEIWDSDKKKVDGALNLNLKRITISNYNKKFFKNNFGIDTSVILNGIDFKKYDIVRKQLNQNKIITFIEHHLPDKGVANAIEAVKMLHDKYDNIEFICFGHKKYHGLPEYVNFYENPDDKTVAQEIYGKTDIFIYPSTKEGFALPPAEAMACRCAVVTTDVGAIPEYSVHMESALHVKPNDIKGMFESVKYLLENESEIKRISENAYKYIRKTLDWDKSVTEFEGIIK